MVMYLGELGVNQDNYGKRIIILIKTKRRKVNL